MSSVVTRRQSAIGALVLAATMTLILGALTYFDRDVMWGGDMLVVVGAVVASSLFFDELRRRRARR